MPVSLPSGWDSYSPSDKINYFNSVGITPDQMLAAGVDQGSIDWMMNNGYNGGAAPTMQDQLVWDSGAGEAGDWGTKSVNQQWEDQYAEDQRRAAMNPIQRQMEDQQREWAAASANTEAGFGPVNDMASIESGGKTWDYSDTSPNQLQRVSDNQTGAPKGAQVYDIMDPSTGQVKQVLHQEHGFGLQGLMKDLSSAASLPGVSALLNAVAPGLGTAISMANNAYKGNWAGAALGGLGGLSQLQQGYDNLMGGAGNITDSGDLGGFGAANNGADWSGDLGNDWSLENYEHLTGGDGGGYDFGGTGDDWSGGGGGGDVGGGGAWDSGGGSGGWDDLGAGDDSMFSNDLQVQEGSYNPDFGYDDVGDVSLDDSHTVHTQYSTGGDGQWRFDPETGERWLDTGDGGNLEQDFVVDDRGQVIDNGGNIVSTGQFDLDQVEGLNNTIGTYNFGGGGGEIGGGGNLTGGGWQGGTGSGSGGSRPPKPPVSPQPPGGGLGGLGSLMPIAGMAINALGGGRRPGGSRPPQPPPPPVKRPGGTPEPPPGGGGGGGGGGGTGGGGVAGMGGQLQPLGSTLNNISQIGQGNPGGQFSMPQGGDPYAGLVDNSEVYKGLTGMNFFKAPGEASKQMGTGTGIGSVTGGNASPTSFSWTGAMNAASPQAAAEQAMPAAPGKAEGGMIGLMEDLVMDRLTEHKAMGGLAGMGGYAQGGTPHPRHPNGNVMFMSEGGERNYVQGPGTGQSDEVPAMLANGEYVVDADIVAALGDGSNEAGAQALDAWREQIRAHKRGGGLADIPPKSLGPDQYFNMAMGGSANGYF